MSTTRESRRLSGRARGTGGSLIREMFERARAYEGDLVRLETGEPDFDTPGFVVDAAAEAAHDGATHYTATAGIDPLREAIAAKIERDNGIGVGPEGVVATAGAVDALATTFLTVVDPGEEVVLPSPDWPNYEPAIREAGGEPVRVPRSPADGFALDVDGVVEAIGAETAAVLLCRPDNPTGRVFDESAVREIARVAAAHDAYVIADEVYERLLYEGSRRSIVEIADDPSWVVSINSASKSYAMTGWRLGWLAAPHDVAEAATTLKQGLSLHPSTLAQHGALAAITGPQAEFEAMVEAYAERRDAVVDRIAGIPGVSCPRPEGAFYAFVDVSGLSGSSTDVAVRLLDEYGVSATPGEAFGPAGEGHLRFSYANSLERLETGLDRFERLVRDER